MYYRFRLLKGIFFPSYSSHQLKQAEAIPRFWPRLFLLVLTSGFIYFLGSYFGLGNEILSKELTSLPSSEFEAKKLLFILGETGWGIIFCLFYLFFPALFFWTVTEIDYKKLVTIQMLAYTVLLIEKMLVSLLALTIGLDQFSSPFSFGVLTQYLTDKNFLIIFFGTISLFHFWIIYLQYIYLTRLSEKRGWVLFLLILGLHAFLLIVSTLLDYIEIERLI
ncbi:hypothetical protein J7I93_03185 [Bacillus sp. ISL-47]|uniref:hypothetical protein n=1 Tax=Bacillus sp. ISL-47 TaxID=2819130 RepID=UPI001BEA8319|nr:hypothetical protein [Bacillus sp. ISL-47]MBT2687182.1 hypothetical protein [Bacillus sp. ISL-47]MBT2709782.1 hypothetical protein [Pseudomonas sp. ISL-84]